MSSAASAGESVDLFKIITHRDAILVGVTETDYEVLQGRDVSAIGRTLVSKEVLTLWQYVAHKGDDGELEMVPLQRVAIFKHETLRVEPFTTPLRIQVSPKRGGD